MRPAKATDCGPVPNPVWNATKDITDIDLAKQRYYRLLAEQEAWNLTKKSK